MSKKSQVNQGGSRTTSYMDLKGQKMDIKSIMKDIELLGSSHMTWREKKDLENKKVVALGGKPPKKQRLPLSVARVTMKKQKEREQKMLQENLILRQFGGNYGSGPKKVQEKRKPEDRVLRSTEGFLKNGVLDVKHLLQPAAPRESNQNPSVVRKGKTKKKGGKKNKGRKNGGGRKSH